MTTKETTSQLVRASLYSDSQSDSLVKSIQVDNGKSKKLFTSYFWLTISLLICKSSFELFLCDEVKKEIRFL